MQTHGTSTTEQRHVLMISSTAVKTAVRVERGRLAAHCAQGVTPGVLCCAVLGCGALSLTCQARMLGCASWAIRECTSASSLGCSTMRPPLRMHQQTWGKRGEGRQGGRRSTTQVGAARLAYIPVARRPPLPALTPVARLICMQSKGGESVLHVRGQGCWLAGVWLPLPLQHHLAHLPLALEARPSVHLCVCEPCLRVSSVSNAVKVLSLVTECFNGRFSGQKSAFLLV